MFWVRKLYLSAVFKYQLFCTIFVTLTPQIYFYDKRKSMTKKIKHNSFTFYNTIEFNKINVLNNLNFNNFFPIGHFKCLITP